MGDDATLTAVNEELLEKVRKKSEHRANEIEAVEDALQTVIENHDIDPDQGGRELVESWEDLRESLLLEIL